VTQLSLPCLWEQHVPQEGVEDYLYIEDNKNTDQKTEETKKDH
jgi:hypothetical protein